MKRIHLDTTAVDYGKYITLKREKESKGERLFHPDGKGRRNAFNGAKGEIAACVYYGFDYTEHVLSAPEQKDFDLRLANGEVVEVKTRGNGYRDFIMPFERKFTADFGLLCTTLPGTHDMLLVGYINQEIWHKHKQIGDFKAGKRWYVSEDYFRSIPERERVGC